MKRFFQVILLCVAVIINSGCGMEQVTSWDYTDVAMGTIIQQYIYGSDEEAAKKTSRRVMDLLKCLEEQQISWRKETSELAKLNATAYTDESVSLSSEMSSVLQQCMDVWEQSEGSFDITIGNVVQLWNIDSWAAGEQEGNYVIPGASSIQEALQCSGSEKIVEQIRNGKTPNEISLPAGMQLDLGAVGKGLSLNYIHQLLKEEPKITAAIISAGGSILVYGTKADGSNWNVGIVNPLDTTKSVATISVGDGWYIATSGDTERYVEVDGVRYHHIIDPQTGYPADGKVRSVTILSRDGLLSDALSTACFVLGVEEGLKLAEQYEAEVLFVLENGEVVMSEGMPVLR